MDIEIPLEIERQPDYTTCGPTSLHAVYKHLGEDISLRQVIDEVPPNPGGGTLNVHLAVQALRRGYRAAMVPFSALLASGGTTSSPSTAAPPSIHLPSNSSNNTLDNIFANW